MSAPLPSTQPRPAARWPVVLLLIIALTLRLAWSLTRPTDADYLAALPDQNEYLRLAKNLLEGRGLIFFDDRFADAVAAFRMPGYPAFVAACGGKVTIVRVVQSLLDTSTVLAAVLLATRAGVGRRGVLLAGAFVAVHPYLIYFSATVLSETLFTAMLAWGMLLLTSASRWRFAGGAALLLLSIYVRPSAIALPVVLGIAAALVRPVAPSRSFWRFGPAALFALLTLATLLPWAIRNRVVVGHYVFTTTNTGISAYDGLNPRADGSSSQAAFTTWPDLKFLSEVERSNHLSRLAADYAAEHPARVARLAAAKLGRTWSPVPLSIQFGQSRLNVIAGAVVIVPLFLLALRGIWKGRLGRSWTLFLLVPALYFSVVHAVTVGALRYRVPADVALAVLAGAAVAPRSRQEV